MVNVEDEAHTVLVSGYTRKDDTLRFIGQDPNAGEVVANFDDMRKAIRKYYPDSSFTIDKIEDLKEYDMVYVWSSG